MWIYAGVILMMAVSHCTSQDDFGDILVIATLPECELNSVEVEEEGVCVNETQCKLSSSTPDPATNFKIQQLSNTPPDPELGECQLNMVCCPKTKVIITTLEMKTPIQRGCGYSNPGGISTRNINDKAGYAEYADFPWMVALMLKKNIPDKTFPDEYIGGGTLIHPSVVMTVAHKVYQAQSKELKCRAGEWNWSIDNEINKYQERDVVEIVINENFHFVQVYYDIALLILSSPFNLENAPNIGIGCLESSLPSPGTVCYSMGWGKDVTNNKNNSKVLKKLEMSLVQSNECEKKLRTTKLGSHYKLHKTKVCAGGEAGVDTCKGDGGSPLVCRIPDPEMLRYSVVGMVAYGDDCGKPNVPGVYVKVPQLYDWVTKQMTARNYNATTFKYM